MQCTLSKSMNIKYTCVYCTLPKIYIIEFVMRGHWRVGEHMKLMSTTVWNGALKAQSDCHLETNPHKICNWESINIPSQKTIKPILDLLLFTYSYYLREPCTTTIIFSVHKSPLTLYWLRIFISSFIDYKLLMLKFGTNYGVFIHFYLSDILYIHFPSCLQSESNVSMHVLFLSIILLSSVI